MWHFKWLLLLVYVIHSESTVYSVGGKRTQKALAAAAANHHQHHRHHLHAHHGSREEDTRKSYKLRHHGTSNLSKLDKFPKLKELNKRLESIQRVTQPPTTTKTPHWKYGYGYMSPAEDDIEADDMNDYYDEDDAEESFVEGDIATTPEAHRKLSAPAAAAGDDEEDEEDTNDEDYDDEIVEESDGLRRHDIQAEESGREQSPMTQYKWENYGTRPKVEESLAKHIHSHHGRDNEHGRQTNSAIHHIFRVKSQAKCRLPRPKVVNVQSVHAAPGKHFRPHCTILHRCADDTGCCEEIGKKCRAKSQEIVYLYFYSTTYSPLQTRIEKLPFYNHTECACMSEDTMPELLAAAPQRLIRAKHGHYASPNKLPTEHVPSCKCPEEFIPTVNHRFSPRFGSAKCHCDCPRDSEVLSGCVNMKFGTEHFSLKDRKCIVEGRCGPPTCEYGTYMKDKGRCPRKQERLDPYSGKTKALRDEDDARNNGDDIDE